MQKKNNWLEARNQLPRLNSTWVGTTRLLVGLPGLGAAGTVSQQLFKRLFLPIVEATIQLASALESIMRQRDLHSKEENFQDCSNLGRDWTNLELPFSGSFGLLHTLPEVEGRY